MVSIGSTAMPESHVSTQKVCTRLLRGTERTLFQLKEATLAVNMAA